MILSTSPAVLRRPSLQVVPLLCLLLAACGPSPDGTLQTARQHLAAREIRQAEVVLKAFLEKQPNDAPARLLLGQTLQAGGNDAAAVVELEKAVSGGADAAQALPALAQTLLATGKYQAIVDRWGRQTLADPAASAELRAIVAMAHAGLGKQDAATTAAKEALEIHPRNAGAKVMLGRLAAAAGSVDEAKRWVDGALEDDPRRADGWVLRGDLRAAAAGEGHDDVIAAYQKALEANPRHWGARTRLFTVFHRRNDVAGMRDQVAAMRSVAPSDPNTAFFAAQLALAEGDTNKARDLAQALLKVGTDNPQVLTLGAAVELRRGNPTLAAPLLNKALQLAPGLKEPRRLLAQLEVRAGRAQRALQVLEPLTAGSPPDLEALTIAAQAHLLAGDAARAQAFFASVAKLNPDDARLRTAAALNKVARGDVASGISMLEATAASDSSTVADLALLNVHLNRGDRPAALRQIERLKSKTPTDPLPDLLMGRLNVKMRQADAARQSFERALAVDANYFPAVQDLAALDLALKRTDAAKRRLREFLVKDPKHAGAALALAEVLRRSEGPSDEMLKLLTDAVKQAPKEPVIRIALVDGLIARRNFGAALIAAQDAVSAMPDQPALVDALGRAQMLKGDLQQSVGSFRKVTVLRPDSPDALVTLARAMMAKNDMASALQHVRRALQLAPDHSQANRLAMQVLVGQKQYDEAVRLSREVQRRHPSYPLGFIFEGDVLLAAGKPDQSVAVYSKALALKPAFEIAKKIHQIHFSSGKRDVAAKFEQDWMRAHPKDAAFLNYLAFNALARNEYAPAEGYFQSVVKLLPKDGAAMNNLAWAQLKQGKPDALAAAEAAVKLSPQDPTARDTYAQALQAAGRLDRAVEEQRRAVELAPADNMLKLGLSKLLLAKGDKSAARKQLEELRQIGGKFPAAQEVDRLLKAL